MKYLIAGLGNPGVEYDGTRHNIGFAILDALAKAHEVKFAVSRLGETCSFKHKARNILLLKPSTFMNLSGKALKYWLTAENIPLENCLVVLDDIALPFGNIRIKPNGSDAGHNGLKNINELLMTQNYARLRFGVGNDFQKGQQSNYVLSSFNNEEKTLTPERIKLASEAIKSFCSIGISLTMTQFNNK